MPKKKRKKLKSSDGLVIGNERVQALFDLGVSHVIGWGLEAQPAPGEPVPDETQVNARTQFHMDQNITHLINTECGLRCKAVANETGQVNLAARRSAGKLPVEEHATHDALVDWVKDMQTVARGLIAAKDETYADDGHWPEAPAGVGDLSQKY